MLDAMRTIAQRLRTGLTGATALGVLGASLPLPAAAQGAVDPNVAPRASELNRQGERGLGIEMLGRYLAVAQSDGRAWFLLSRFYRMDARDWHLAGHRGDPSAEVYLSLATVAVDEATRLRVDSAPLFRALVAMDEALLALEDSGWTAVVRSMGGGLPPLPPAVLELGRNLAASCPLDGVLVTGSELESLAAWHATLEPGGRADLVPLRVDLFVRDSLYRRRMAEALAVDATVPTQAALAQVARRHPLCLAPAADTTGMPPEPWTPRRLARVSNAAAPAATGFSLTSLVTDVTSGGSIWTPEVVAAYATGARHNDLLCQSLAPVAGVLPAGTCAR